MKVIICIATSSSGGAERQVSYISHGLVKLGHEVHVILIKKGEIHALFLKSKATIHFLNIFPQSFRFFGPLINLFNDIKPDVIYLWQRPFDILGSISAMLLNIPHIHAERTDPYKITNGIKKQLRNFLVPKSNGVIANSDLGYKYWASRLKNKRIHRLNNIIPFEEIRRIEKSLETSGYFLSVGRLDRNKNHMLLLKSIYHLKNNGIDCKIMIVGDGPEFDNLLAYIHKHELQQNVILAGYRNDIYSLMKGSLGLISLSYYEGEPNVVLEALAADCNVILSDINPHRQFENLFMDNIIYVKKYTEIELASAIKFLIDSSKMRLNSTMRYRNDVEEFFLNRSALSIAKSHVDIFNKVINCSRISRR